MRATGRRGGRTTRPTSAIAAALLAGLVLAACVPMTSEPEAPPAPPFPGLPSVAPYAGSECKTVLVIGDSIAWSMGRDLEEAFAETGRCADVVNAGAEATSVVQWAPGGSAGLDDALAGVTPDLVVVHLVGNQGDEGPNAGAPDALPWTDPDWLPTTIAAALAIVDGLPAGVPVYWSVPLKSAWSCDWTSLNAQRWDAWAAWVRDVLAVERPEVHVSDWRPTFGGDEFVLAYEFDDGSTDDVRLTDCVHLSRTGDGIAAALVVAASAGEWP